MNTQIDPNPAPPQPSTAAPAPQPEPPVSPIAPLPEKKLARTPPPPKPRATPPAESTTDDSSATDEAGSPSRKFRSDAKLLNLREIDRDQLADWLIGGMSYKEARDRVSSNFRIWVSSLTHFSEFWALVCVPRMIAQRQLLLSDAKSQASSVHGQPDDHLFDVATADSLRQRAFQLARSSGSTSDDLRFALEIHLRLRNADIQDSKLSIERCKYTLQSRRFELAREKAELDSLGSNADPPTLGIPPSKGTADPYGRLPDSVMSMMKDAWARTAAARSNPAQSSVPSPTRSSGTASAPAPQPTSSPTEISANDDTRPQDKPVTDPSPQTSQPTPAPISSPSLPSDQPANDARASAQDEPSSNPQALATDQPSPHAEPTRQPATSQSPCSPAPRLSPQPSAPSQSSLGQAFVFFMTFCGGFLAAALPHWFMRVHPRHLRVFLSPLPAGAPRQPSHNHPASPNPVALARGTIQSPRLLPLAFSLYTFFRNSLICRLFRDLLSAMRWPAPNPPGSPLLLPNCQSPRPELTHPPGSSSLAFLSAMGAPGVPSPAV